MTSTIQKNLKICLCVCNQGAYTDNLTEVVERLLAN